MSQDFQTNLHQPDQMLGAALSVQNVAAVYAGAGAPGFAAQKGSLYLRTDGSSTSTRAYINTNGSTGWTNLVTAS